MNRKKRREKVFNVVIVALIIILAIILILLVLRETKGSRKSESIETVVTTSGETQTMEVESEESVDVEELEVTEVSETETETEVSITKMVSDMSVEEKVAQLFMITPEALTGYSQVTQAGEASREAYNNRPVGGIVLMENNLAGPTELVAMTDAYYQFGIERNGVPLLVGIDEEGGTVLRIGKNSNFNVEYIGNMSDITTTSAAYEVGKTLGGYLNTYGINVDFAPVADVCWNQANEVVRKRSFSSDANIVSEMVEQEIYGLQSQGVSATLKHFPGHGGTTEDSHVGYAYVYSTIDELRNGDLKPFKRGIEAGVELIMVGHICAPQTDSGEMPASLSKYWITDILRDEMGFEGVVITDALNMGAISSHYSSAEACLKAFEAGTDILLMPQDFDSAYQGILDAVNDGRISKERLDQSVERILKLKKTKVKG